MGRTISKNANTTRLIFEQNEFTGGINTKDNSEVIQDNAVKFAKNFDLTPEGRLEKRRGFNTIYTHKYIEEFEGKHPELGKILGNIKGKQQSYQRFKQTNGEYVEFFAINGRLYKYPHLFDKYPKGVLWDIYDENNTPINFKFQNQEKFDIALLENRLFFATGTRLLEYSPVVDQAGIISDTNYILKFVKPYEPLLQEFLDVKYGQNLLVTDSEDRKKYLNTKILGKNGFLGITTNPNILYPSNELKEFIPIINQDGLPDKNLMATQVATRKIAANSGYTNNINQIVEVSERFGVPSDINLNNGESTSFLINSTDQLEILGTTFNANDTALEAIKINKQPPNLVAFNNTKDMYTGIHKKDNSFTLYQSRIYESIIDQTATNVYTFDDIEKIISVKTAELGPILVGLKDNNSIEKTVILDIGTPVIEDIYWDGAKSFGYDSLEALESDNRGIDNINKSVYNINSSFDYAYRLRKSHDELWYLEEYFGGKRKYKEFSSDLAGTPDEPDNSHRWKLVALSKSISGLTLNKSLGTITYSWYSNANWQNTSNPSATQRTEKSGNGEYKLNQRVDFQEFTSDENLVKIKVNSVINLKELLDTNKQYNWSNVANLNKEYVYVKKDNDKLTHILLRPKYDGNEHSDPNWDRLNSTSPQYELVCLVPISAVFTYKDPVTIVNDYAIKESAQINSREIIYSTEESIVKLDIVTTKKTIISTNDYYRFTRLVENSDNSIIGVTSNSELKNAIYRIDNLNFTNPKLLWVDDNINSITKYGSTYMYTTDKVLKKTNNWQSTTNINYSIDEGYKINQSWSISVNNYGFIINNEENTNYAISNINTSKIKDYITYYKGKEFKDSKIDSIEKDGEELKDLAAWLMRIKDQQINRILFSSNATIENPGIPNYDIEVKIKFPDYKDYVTAFFISGNEINNIKEYLMLMYEIEDIKCIARFHTGETVGVATWIVGYVINPPDDKTNFFSLYKHVVSPQLTAVDVSVNVNNIQDCNRIYYKNGYLMLYGNVTNSTNNRGNTIFISDVYRYNYFPQFSTIDIYTQGDEKIQSINAWNSEIEQIIFLDNSILSFKFNSPTEIEIKQITDVIGLYAPYSVAAAENKLQFLAKDGIYSLVTVQYSNAGVNAKLISEPISSLMYSYDGTLNKDSVAYTKNSKYNIIIPDIKYLENGFVKSTNRQFKLYGTNGVTSTWYMDESKYLDISKVYKEGNSIQLLRNNTSDLLIQNNDSYVDGNLDQYWDYVELNLPPIEGAGDFEIYNAVFESKNYSMASQGYGLHKKQSRANWVNIGLGNHNVNLVITGKIDGQIKKSNKIHQLSISDGRVVTNVVDKANHSINIGTVMGLNRFDSAFTWNVSKWGQKEVSLNSVSNFGQGKNMGVFVEQIQHEPTGFTILSIGIEYRARSVKKQV